MMQHQDLPIMPVGTPPNWYDLKISGKVPEETKFSANDILDMPTVLVVGDFFCNDGWVVKGLTWEGILVSHLLKIVGANIEATKSIEFRSENYIKSFGIHEALQGNVILATKLNGTFLSSGHGGPCRLIGGSRSGDNHVKWVKSIQVK